jgi:2-succinyl-5-enolpyruvyl-6-hydroxy-3-cyclohexene-1-carboxylate synthase
VLSRQAWQAAADRSEAFGEAQLAHRIHRYLPDQGQLFVGNSLVVRLIDALAQLPAGYPVYSNRGASGIDGLLATAAGFSAPAPARRWRSSAISPRSTI